MKSNPRKWALASIGFNIVEILMVLPLQINYELKTLMIVMLVGAISGCILTLAPEQQEQK